MTLSNTSLGHVAVIAESLTALPALMRALRTTSIYPDASDILVLVPIERFYAPASTHLPYRRMARAAARDINAERVMNAICEARAVLSEIEKPWSLGRIQPFFKEDLKPAVALLKEHEQLVVCAAYSNRRASLRPSPLACKLAKAASASLFVVPETAHSSRFCVASIGNFAADLQRAVFVGLRRA